MKKLFVLVVTFSLLASGCKLIGPRNEKQDFIDATIESSCVYFQYKGDPTNVELATQMNDIFKKHGFDVENKEGMTAIVDKYKVDSDVVAAVSKGSEACGKEFFDQLTGKTTIEEAPVATDLDTGAGKADPTAVAPVPAEGAEVPVAQPTDTPAADTPAETPAAN
jgi:hypothetical protein